MTLFTASDARRRFGRLLETVQREPVTTTKNGRAVAIIVPSSDNDLILEMQEFLEDRQWCERISEAERGGYIGVQESKRILREALNAEG